ncbi:MAG: integrase core domain-containing protein [Patescibacteria group bacterium]
MYTINPHMPKLRMEAVRLVKYRGWSTRKVARYTGFDQSAIVKWCKKDPTGGWRRIPTESSRPHRHPRQLKDHIVEKIIAIRIKARRTSEVAHRELLNQGIRVSLNSVRRTIDRYGLMKKRSPWKRYHPHVDRPIPQKPGDLVQLDTIHRMIDEKKRMYIFVLIDVYSRWVYAKAYARMNGATTLCFVAEAQRHASFLFDMLQSDHGPEFGKWFVSQVRRKHRYSRIGKPNNNAHVERFNRTLQEECLDKYPNDVEVINCALKKYLRYYNYQRLHMGIALQVPMQLVANRFQAIG